MFFLFISSYFFYLISFFFFFKQKTAYEMLRSLVGSEMCIRDRFKHDTHTAPLSEYEKSLLIQGVQAYGTSWKGIAQAYLRWRPTTMLSRTWKQLLLQDPTLLSLIPVKPKFTYSRKAPVLPSAAPFTSNPAPAPLVPLSAARPVVIVPSLLPQPPPTNRTHDAVVNNNRFNDTININLQPDRQPTIFRSSRLPPSASQQYSDAPYALDGTGGSRTGFDTKFLEHYGGEPSNMSGGASLFGLDGLPLDGLTQLMASEDFTMSPSKQCMPPPPWNGQSCSPGLALNPEHRLDDPMHLIAPQGPSPSKLVFHQSPLRSPLIRQPSPRKRLRSSPYSLRSAGSGQLPVQERHDDEQDADDETEPGVHSKRARRLQAVQAIKANHTEVEAVEALAGLSQEKSLSSLAASQSRHRQQLLVPPHHEPPASKPITTPKVRRRIQPEKVSTPRSRSKSKASPSAPTDSSKTSKGHKQNSQKDQGSVAPVMEAANSELAKQGPKGPNSGHNSGTKGSGETGQQAAFTKDEDRMLLKTAKENRKKMKEMNFRIALWAGLRQQGLLEREPARVDERFLDFCRAEPKFRKHFGV
eukprot:TRINITY_DN11790_c0_g2_i4.p1 TRINITY_DN11790_c0_g2~~TRINITY_DN11790_c0_g2_i4.p1  ORF type:complete len:582 (+),score=123.69 TRINITY_DN11790_c0_g2_i4:45-1790(+)